MASKRSPARVAFWSGSVTPPPGSFALNAAVSGAVQTRAGVAVTSKGDAVTYRVIGGVVEGVADLGGDSERVVFTLTDNGNGTFTFYLDEVLDRLPLATGGGDLEEVLTLLELTPPFTATRPSGDPVMVTDVQRVEFVNALEVAASDLDPDAAITDFEVIGGTYRARAGLFEYDQGDAARKMLKQLKPLSGAIDDFKNMHPTAARTDLKIGIAAERKLPANVVQWLPPLLRHLSAAADCIGVGRRELESVSSETGGVGPGRPENELQHSLASLLAHYWERYTGQPARGKETGPFATWFRIAYKIVMAGDPGCNTADTELKYLESIRREGIKLKRAANS